MAGVPYERPTIALRARIQLPPSLPFVRLPRRLKKCLHCIIHKGVPELFPIEEISALVYTPKWQPQDIRPMFWKFFYGPITREQNRNLPQPLQPDHVVLYDGFLLSQSNFQEWLRVWRMDVSERHPNNKDLLSFVREMKSKFTDLVENEIQKLIKAPMSNS